MITKYPRPPDIRGRVYIYPTRNGLCLYCGKDLSFDGRRISFCCNEHARLYDEQFTWEVQKRAIFVRDNYTCVKCGFNEPDFRKKLSEKFPQKYGFWENMDKRSNYSKSLGFDSTKSLIECDHIHAIKMGGHPFDHNNLQTLCQVCHKKKTKQDMKYMNQMNTLCRAIRKYFSDTKSRDKMNDYWGEVFAKNNLYSTR